MADSSTKQSGVVANARSQRSPLLTSSSHPEKQVQGGVCFLSQTVRVIFMNDLLLGLRA